MVATQTHMNPRLLLRGLLSEGEHDQANHLLGLEPTVGEFLSESDLEPLYQILEEVSDLFLSALVPHIETHAFIEFCAFVVSDDKKQKTSLACVKRLSLTTPLHEELLFALVSKTPSEMLEKFKTLTPEVRFALRLRLAFEALTQGGEQSRSAWAHFKRVGFALLQSPNEKTSLVWLARFYDIANAKTFSQDAATELLKNALQTNDKERHRLLCAFLQEQNTHNIFAKVLAESAGKSVEKFNALKSALFDVFCDEADVYDFERFDFYAPLLKELSTLTSPRVLSPVKRQLTCYSAWAQRVRDTKRAREISQMLKPLAATFDKFESFYRKNGALDVVPLLGEEPSFHQV